MAIMTAISRGDEELLEGLIHGEEVMTMAACQDRG